MATIDAVMSEKRAADIIAKYRKRMDDWSKDADATNSVDEFNAIVTELQSDIANGINAAVAEAVAAVPKPATVEHEPEHRTRPATTHMPATGHDKPAAHR